MKHEEIKIKTRRDVSRPKPISSRYVSSTSLAAPRAGFTAYHSTQVPKNPFSFNYSLQEAH
jgi:hypothetical protein